jgi:hypothetical protein
MELEDGESQPMDTMTYADDTMLLVLDDAVIEVFRRLVSGSQRIPLVWAGATLKPKQGDEIQVEVGVASNPGDPFYTDAVTGSGAFDFSIPQSEAAALRSFFDEAARRGQRA